MDASHNVKSWTACSEGAQTAVSHDEFFVFSEGFHQYRLVTRSFPAPETAIAVADPAAR